MGLVFFAALICRQPDPEGLSSEAVIPPGQTEVFLRPLPERWKTA